ARAVERLQRVEDQVQERLPELPRVEHRLRAGRIVRAYDLDSLGGAPGAAQLQALVEHRVERRQRTVQLGRAAERGDLGDDAREVVDRARDLPGQLLRLGVAGTGQPLLEVVDVEAQPRQRILHFVGDLGRHASERGDGAAPQALEVVRVAD